MMITRRTLDAFALTNPARCSLIIHSFTSGYEEEDPGGMELPLAYLALPFTMTSSFAATFRGTTAATGLFKWFARSPEVRLELDSVIEETAPLTRAGLLFGMQRKVLALDPQQHRLRADSTQLIRAPRDPSGADITARAHTIARRFGGWCGKISSARTVFTALGVVA